MIYGYAQIAKKHLTKTNNIDGDTLDLYDWCVKMKLDKAIIVSFKFKTGTDSEYIYNTYDVWLRIELEDGSSKPCI